MASFASSTMQGFQAASKSVLRLPTLGGVAFDFVVTDELGTSILWVNDAFVYEFHGQASLSFVFAAPEKHIRNTARIINRITRSDSACVELQLFQTLMRINIDEFSHVLNLTLCESDIIDAPAILTTEDYLKFRTNQDLNLHH